MDDEDAMFEEFIAWRTANRINPKPIASHEEKPPLPIDPYPEDEETPRRMEEDFDPFNLEETFNAADSKKRKMFDKQHQGFENPKKSDARKTKPKNEQPVHSPVAFRRSV